MDREMELNHLRQAEVHIAQAHGRIKRQNELIQRLRRDGHDIAGARALLVTMQETLEVMEQHREQIFRETMQGQ